MLKLKSVILLFVFSIFPVSIFYSPVSYLNFLGLHIDLFVTRGIFLYFSSILWLAFKFPNVPVSDINLSC